VHSLPDDLHLQRVDEQPVLSEHKTACDYDITEILRKSSMLSSSGTFMSAPTQINNIAGERVGKNDKD